MWHASGHTVSSELCSRKRRVCEMWQRVQSFFASTCLLVAALPALPTADSVFLHRSPLQTSTLVLLFLCDPSCCRQASSEASSGRGTLRATTAMSARPLSRHASHVTCSSLQADGGSCKSAGAPFLTPLNLCQCVTPVAASAELMLAPRWGKWSSRQRGADGTAA